jgi:hypothetical protein
VFPSERPKYKRKKSQKRVLVLVLDRVPGKFVVSFQIRKCDSFNVVLLFQDCFGYSATLFILQGGGPNLM